MRLTGTTASLTRDSAGSVGSVAVDRDAASLTWVGHATVLVEIDGVRLLTDPVLRRRVGPCAATAPLPDAAADGSDVDAVLISHLHHDHADLPSLRRLAGRCRCSPAPAPADFLARLGFERRPRARAGRLRQRRRRRASPPPRPSTTAAAGGWRLRAASRAIGFELRGRAADLLRRRHRPLRRAWRRSGAAASTWRCCRSGAGARTLGAGHLDPERAARAAALLCGRGVAVPIHWGTLYPLGLARLRPEPLRAPAARVRRSGCASWRLTSEVRVLAPGEATSLA